MAQRNPMNERYQGDGPQGKTRKSAAKLKPKTEAASSVHMTKKPQTRQEKKAAQKKRDKEIAAKEAERTRKRRERERLQLEKAGISVEEPEKPKSMAGSVKDFFGPSQKMTTAQKDAERTAVAAALTKAESKKGKKAVSDLDKEAALSSGQKAAQEVVAPKKKEQPPVSKTGINGFLLRRNAPNTPEYIRLRKIYFVLLIIGGVCLLSTFVISWGLPHLANEELVMAPIIVAYLTIIGAMVIDFTKIRRMEANNSTSSDKRSPKQIKHDQKQAEAAALIEEAKKAKKEQRREKIPFIGKSKNASDTEEEEENILDQSDGEEAAAEEATAEEASTEDSAAIDESDNKSS